MAPAALDGASNPVRSEARAAVVARVASMIELLSDGRPRLVAIDGVDGAGKTTFANELAACLAGGRRPIVRASVDSFHHSKVFRYRRGNASPEGYYLDSFDLRSLRSMLLDPIRHGSAPTFRRAAFSEPLDRPVEAPAEAVQERMVLLFDGVFAQRPELRGYWDLTVLLEAGERTEAAWQSYVNGGLPPSDPARRAEMQRRETVGRRRRYVDGQARYFAEARPRDHADLIIDNNDLAAPVIVVDRPGPRYEEA